MKKLILVALIFVSFRSATNAQQENQFNVANDLRAAKPVSFSNTSPSGPDKDHDYYMRKRNNHLTAGVVTLGSGLLLSGIGLITSNNSTSFDMDATAAILFIAGAASGIASIPLMIMAHVYNHKARLIFKNQKTGFGVPSHVDKYITGITMTIPIGK